MNGIRNKKKKRFWKPAAAVFLTLYLATMGLATLLVKQKFEEDYIRTFEQVATSIHRKATNQEDSMAESEEFSGEDKRREYYRCLVNEYFWSTTNPQLNIAVAVYDKEQNLLANSYDAIGDMMYMADTAGINVGPFNLDDYLTFKQKEELAEHCWKERQSTENYTLPGKYRFLIRISSDGKELYDIFVQELTWEEGEEANEKQYKNPLTGEMVTHASVGLMVDYATGKEYGTERIFHVTDSKILWEWANPDISKEERKNGEVQDAGLVFPYITSYERWHRWSSSKYLHSFPNPGEFFGEAETAEAAEAEYPSIYSEREGLLFRCKYKLKVEFVDDPYVYMEIRMEERPWSDAFEYMKYLYLAGLLLTVLCVFVVSHTFEQTYARQMALEETRRDITNAMAHELKTPLGIIRNFAENLIEHNMEEKRDYYLTQIIGQTEEMDSLVREMIEISKLDDSEELALKKETVSFGELIREEMKKFEPMIDEKNIQVQYQEDADFLVEGDREYLGKAVWNLISNAVEYNVPDGRILVRTEAGKCVIENTGKTMEEEQLLHAFDLFYTGNKSRGKKEKHMGIGLFLVKKILGLHGMGVMIENTEEGIRVTVKHLK
ncbi:MAG: HAMP domain-containing histidine kinase [Dorea sp.]|nr:HAMP domain-containing histidine kinase [Dorea sp.]